MSSEADEAVQVLKNMVSPHALRHGGAAMERATDAREKHPRASRPKLARFAVGSAVALVLIVVATRWFMGEPLRRYMERTLNADLKGYTARLEGVTLHPFGFSLTLRGLTIAQAAHPKPPVAEFPSLHASVHWAALLHGRLVADFLFREPHVRIDLTQMRQEAADRVPIKDKGWQQALESVYPLKIDLFRIENADFTYIDSDSSRPLHISRLNLVADNIRNVRSRERVYPSDVHLDGIIFDSGAIHANGHADFLSEPYAGIDTDVSLDRVDLGYFKPILARLNLEIAGGTLSADGHAEYAPQRKDIELRHLTLRSIRLDYVHRAQTATQEKERVAKVGRAAEQVSRTPDAVVHIDTVHIADSMVGFVNQAADPGYRVFLANSDLTIKNLSNQAEEAPASAALKGQFMGSGASVVKARVRPAAKSPDLFVALEVEGTQLRAMNDLLRTFGNFDVNSGEFSLYSELTIKNGEITGYMKPIFRGMSVYSRSQDAGKPLPHQVYEGIVGAVQTILQNGEREVGTKVDISGRVAQPQTSTLEIVLGLLENAFIKSITHEFDSQQ